MKAIIIGAGRGSRLGDRTDEVPKTLVEVVGRPMLDWILDALAHAGFPRDQVIFVAGYRADVIRRRYPELQFVENAGWEHNNILVSLMCARQHMQEGFLCSYSDIVYDPEIARRVSEAPEDLVLGCDTAWRRRYRDRSQHPESDAEKLTADGRRVTAISRRIPSEAASGEFIGVLKASPAGAARFCAGFDQAQRKHQGGVFREGRVFERAYLIDLLAELLEAREPMVREDTPGGYMEIDTLEDLGLADRWWREFREASAP